MPSPVVLTPVVSGLPFSGSAHNSNLALIEASFLGVGTGIISGLVPTVGAGLSVNVSLGVAVIGAQISPAAFVIGSLTPSTTNHLFLQQNGTGTSNTTGTPPANSVKLGTCLTGASIVTSVAVGCTSGRQQFLPPQSLIPGGPAAGIASAGHPDALNLAQWNATDIEGKSFYGVLPAGAVTSGSLPADVAYTDAANSFVTPAASGSQITQVNDAAASATITGLRIRHGTSAGPANFIGVELDFQVPNSTPAFVTAGAIYGQLASVVPGAEFGTLGFEIPMSGVLTEGLKLQPNGAKLQVRVLDEFRHIGGTFAAFNATPVVQPSSTTDIRLALISLGFLATGGASPMNLNGGALTAGVAALGATTITGTHTVTGNQIVQGLSTAQVTKTTTYTATLTDFTIFGDTTGASFTVTLPTAASAPGKIYCFKRIDVTAHSLTIAAAGGDNVEGAATAVISGGLATMWLQSNGVATWWAVKP